MSVRAFSAAALGLLLLSGCGSSAPALDLDDGDAQANVSDARKAVREAEQRGAEEHAEEALRSAQTKLDRANTALDAGNMERAYTLAAEAEVDAELAEIRALSRKAQIAADEVRAGIELLRDEIRRLQAEG
ncbi:MAG: DUF4398 domain-containing protein [Bacteroidota bacterium]